MAVRSLWGRCVPGLELAGPLTSHGHGYGLGTCVGILSGTDRHSPSCVKPSKQCGTFAVAASGP